MARQEHTGICHICGEYKKLTYEHIPPEAAFNSQRRKMSTVKELMENKKDNRAPWDIEGLKYKQFQQGTGFFTLCGECNSFTGAKYGVTYSDFIKAIKCTLCQGHYDFSFSDFYFIFVCCVEASK